MSSICNCSIAWDIDLSEEKIAAFYQRLEAQYARLLKIYGDGTRAEAEAFMSENLQPTAFMRFAFDRVDARFPEDAKDAANIESICKLPERE